jgi:hypothetical protein
MSIVIPCRMTGHREYLAARERAKGRVPATTASGHSGLETHACDFGEDLRPRIISEGVAVSLEVDMCLDSRRLRRESERAASGEQPPVAEEGVAAAEKVDIGRLHIDKRL